jgi:hypothetical protein
VGGGPDAPIGSRRRLLSTLAHTRGADDIFVRLYRQARAHGCRDATKRWWSGKRCRLQSSPSETGWIRRVPTRYALRRLLPGVRPWHDERARLLQEVRAYYRYGVTRRFERDYNSYPTILVVTLDNAAEERIARVARATAVGQPGELPVLLTCQWRIDDVTNSDGLLNPIWREPNSDFDNRRHWVRIPHSSVKHRMP